MLITEYNEVEQKNANEAIGYRKNTDNGTVFYAYPERLKDALRQELAADINDVLRLADGLGMPERNKEEKHLTKVVKIAKKSKRMLVFNNKVLTDEG